MTPLRNAHRRTGFTLIEMLAVVLFTAVVMSFAVNFYLQMSRQSSAAADLTERRRRTTLTLDRIARDLQETVLIVREEEEDALAFPWFFLAEASRSGDGADRIKFQTRANRPRGDTAHESDLAVVAFWTTPDDSGDTLQLLRWSRSRLPESLDQSFPRREDDGVQVLADRVASFGIRLLDEDGNWGDSWDSAQLQRSNELPLQAELHLALWDDDVVDPAFAELPEPQTRRVSFPVRPIKLTPEENEESPDDEEEDEEDLDCITVAECRSSNPELFDGLAAGDPAFAGLLEAVAQECVEDQIGALGVNLDDLEGCE